MKKIFKIIVIISLILTGSYLNSEKLNENYLKAYFIYLQGFEEENKANYSKAINLYKNSIKLYKKFPEPYYRIALIYYKNSENQLAANYIEKSCKYENGFKNKTDYNDFLIKAADIFYKIKKYDASLKFYKKLIKLQLKPEYLYRIGDIYYIRKDFDSSKKYLKEFLELYIDSEDTLKQNKRIDSDFEHALKMLVNISMEKSDYEQALKYLKIIYRYYPTKEIKDKLSILSNNLRYYDNK